MPLFALVQARPGMVSILHVDRIMPVAGISGKLCTSVVATNATRTYVRILDILRLGTGLYSDIELLPLLITKS